MAWKMGLIWGLRSISAVNDDIARLEERQQRRNEIIDGLTRLDQQNNLAGFFERSTEFLNRTCPNDLGPYG